MNESFQPARLSLARRRRGMGKGALAASAGLSARAVVAYEAGKSTPTETTVARLAAALAVPIAFFQLPEPATIDVSSVSFRSMARMTAGMRDSALASGELAFELDSFLMALIKFVHGFDDVLVHHILTVALLPSGSFPTSRPLSDGLKAVLGVRLNKQRLGMWEPFGKRLHGQMNGF